MQMHLEIDGETAVVELRGSDHVGFDFFYELGKDITGRPCRAKERSAPIRSLRIGSSVRVGDHTYKRVASPSTDSIPGQKLLR